MKYPKELCVLMIRNMEIIEKAPIVVDAMEKELFSAINAKIEAFVNREGWEGVFGLGTNENQYKETSFKPEEWPNDKDYGWYKAWYTLAPVSEKKQSFLASSVNVNGAVLALGFSFNSKYFDELPAKKTLLSLIEKNSQLKDVGFQFYQRINIIGIEFVFNSEDIATDYSESDSSFNVTLKPLDEALEKLLSVHSEFDDFVKSLEGKMV